MTIRNDSGKQIATVNFLEQFPFELAVTNAAMDVGNPINAEKIAQVILTEASIGKSRRTNKLFEIEKPQAFKSLEIMAIEIVSNETEVKTAIVKYDSLVEFEFAN